MEKSLAGQLYFINIKKNFRTRTTETTGKKYGQKKLKLTKHV